MTIVTIYALFGDDVRTLSTDKVFMVFFLFFFKEWRSCVLCAQYNKHDFIWSWNWLSFSRQRGIFLGILLLARFAVNDIDDTGYRMDFRRIVWHLRFFSCFRCLISKVSFFYLLFVMFRAGRASRIGTRAGRIVRIVRLIRLVKLYKHA